MGLFKKKNDPPPPPQFTPNNQFDNQRQLDLAAASQPSAYENALGKQTLSYFNSLDAGGAAKDFSSLAPTAYASYLGATALRKKNANTLPSGAAGFARNYANPNMLATQAEERQRAGDEQDALTFAGGVAANDAQMRGQAFNLAGMDQSRRLGILSSDTSRANTNQSGMVSAYNAYLNRPRQPSFWKSLLGGAAATLGGAFLGPVGAAAGGALAGSIFGGGDPTSGYPATPGE